MRTDRIEQQIHEVQQWASVRQLLGDDPMPEQIARKADRARRLEDRRRDQRRHYE